MKTYCLKGHVLTPDTTGKRKISGGKTGRFCLLCKAEHNRLYSKARRFYKRLKNLTVRIPNILRNPVSFKASELKKIDIGSCYLAEIRAAQPVYPVRGKFTIMIRLTSDGSQLDSSYI